MWRNKQTILSSSLNRYTHGWRPKEDEDKGQQTIELARVHI